MSDHLWAEISRSGYVLCYAWQDGKLFRVNLRKQTPKGDLVCGAVAMTFDEALEDAVSAISEAELIAPEIKAQSWSIDTTPEASLAARLGVGRHAPIVRRF